MPDERDDELEWIPPDTAPPTGDDEPRPQGRGSASPLAAAMLAVGEILEPEKTKVEIQQEDDEPEDEPPFTLDFGDLPPLN